MTGIADDTFVFGATEKEHDENTMNLMNRSREKGIKFNEDKIQFKCQEVSFFGHKWTPDGIKLDDKKISAIQNMAPPENRKDLQSSLGLVNYLTRYSDRLASITAPLRDLTKKDITYIWEPDHHSNITRETLDVVSGLEGFNYFIFGKHCTVNTKPLESIFKKSLSSFPPRMQRFLMRALRERS